MTLRRPLPGALLVLGVALAPAGIPTPAAAAARRCVAVIVDSGSGLSGRCTDWSSGMTGLEALSATGHSFRYAPSGLICAIDGFPADCRVDPTHYWSYWHRSPGGTAWSYSNEGAGTYRPAVNSTEGWAYQNGSSRQPRTITFAAICPTAAPAPSPTASPSQPPVPTPQPTTRPTSRPTSGPPTPAPAASPAGNRPPAATASGPGGPGSAVARPQVTAAPGVTGTVPPRAGSPSAQPSHLTSASASGPALPTGGPSTGGTTAVPVLPVADHPPTASAPGRPMLATGAGLVAAAALGTLAWRRTRRRV